MGKSDLNNEEKDYALQSWWTFGPGNVLESFHIGIRLGARNDF